MIYYLFNPHKNIKNPYWYKYLPVDDKVDDFLWSYQPEKYFQSQIFTVYICKRRESYESISYNVCKLDNDVLLYYYDNILFITCKQQCDNKILQILNKYQNIGSISK